jgi:MGT family glycosyltransferase
VLAVDQQAVAGALVARRRRLPWATLSTTSAGVTDPLATLPQVKEWLRGLFDTLAREAEVEPVDQEMSPRLVIAFTTAALVGPLDRFPAHYRFVGPSIHDRPEATPFPWELLRDDVPRVLVSMGTVNAEASGRFYATALAALRDEPVQVIVAAPPELVGEVPANAIVRRYVPQLALLPYMTGVICHGGHNTVCESLAHGRPLVIAPIKDDQPIVADQVVAAGAGLRVKFGRVQAVELRDAVRRVLGEPSFGTAAETVRDSFAAAGGASAAADALEALS